MSDQSINLTIEVDDNGSVKIRQFGDKTVRTTRDVVNKSGSLLKKIQSRMGAVARAAGGIIRKLFSLKTMALGALAGWGVKKLMSSFIDVGSSMDMMKLSLDTITKGKGEQWFRELNEWALKMPINTKVAINAFTQMRAMGLEPTIEQMTTLVDTTSALGGQSDTLLGISRALGQMATKGRVSTEELLQLAERGVPVFQILKEKLGLTNEELGKIGTLGLDAQKTIGTLIEGMEERFGGQSEKMQGMWAGLIESLKSFWSEFQRMIMDSGVMEYLEKKLSAIMANIEGWYKDGTMQAWAQSIANSVTAIADTLWSYMTGIWERLPEWYRGASEWIYWMIEDLKPLGAALVRIINFLDRMISQYQKWKTVLVGNSLSGAGMEDLIQKIGGSTPGTDSDGGFSIDSAPQFAKGTGPSGLPYTGLFYGHKGEIIKNPAESAAERQGAGINITVAPTFMTGDRTAARSVAAEISRELKQLNLRWGTS